MAPEGARVQKRVASRPTSLDAAGASPRRVDAAEAQLPWWHLLNRPRPSFQPICSGLAFQEIEVTLANSHVEWQKRTVSA